LSLQTSAYKQRRQIRTFGTLRSWDFDLNIIHPKLRLGWEARYLPQV
jgi:hypothetical protein